MAYSYELPISRRTFLAGSALGLGVLAGCLSILESSGEQTNTDGTKSYTNRKYDFEITYPETWILQKEDEDIDNGFVKINAPTATYAISLVIDADRLASAQTWEEIAELELQDHLSNIAGYSVIAQRDIDLSNRARARIVDARWPRSTDNVMVRQKMMSTVNADGLIRYFVAIIGREEIYNSESFDATAERVLSSFKTLS